MNDRAGLPASESDLTDIPQLLDDYHDIVPNPDDPAQRVSFGTSGHRGTSSAGSFNEAHIAAITQAIVEYRQDQGITGPLFLARDTHALSEPAFLTVNEVLAAANVPTFIDERDGYTPTPVLSFAVLRHNREAAGTHGQADGIILTPSHNPPTDGGIKYNPPHGGPAGAEETAWIENRANELLPQWQDIPRTEFQRAFHLENTQNFDYIGAYVGALDDVVDMQAIQSAGLRIGADPLGGAAVDVWAAIADTYDLDLTVINPTIDPTWSFMHLDWDGKIRMDCSSEYAMAGLIEARSSFDIAVGNDPDADRHGIVTPDGGLMNPNQYLATAIDYLLTHRPGWTAGALGSAGVGKTLVSSRLIDAVITSHGRSVYEVPVGFKWFVPGLLDSSLVFGGEESAGASFLDKQGRPWSTDKDGIIMSLLAAEMLAVTGQTPSQRCAELIQKHGEFTYRRVEAAADRGQKAKLKSISADSVTADSLAGEPITAVRSHAPGNEAAIGGLKVETESAWFAARPSGTEDIYKIYAESARGSEHLQQVIDEAQALVDSVLAE